MSGIETIGGGLDTFLRDLQQFREARTRLTQIFQELEDLGDVDFTAPSAEFEATARLSVELSAFTSMCNSDAVALRQQAEALGLLGKALLLFDDESDVESHFVVTFYPEQGVAEPWQDIEFWAVASPELKGVA